jgi:hypothetical protein
VSGPYLIPLVELMFHSPDESTAKADHSLLQR